MALPESSSPHSAAKPRLLIVGAVAKDELIRGHTTRQAWGGVPVYAGQTALQMGWEVEAWTALPEAEASAVKAAFPSIHWHVSPSAEATRFVNREGEGMEREQHSPSQANTLMLGMPNIPAKTMWDWVHLGPLHPKDMALEAAQTMVKSATKSSLDVQGLVRRVNEEGRILAAIAPSVRAWLTGISWVKASTAEWALLADSLGMGGEQARAHFGWDGLLVTAGERGGIAYTAEGQFAWKAHLPAAVRMETGAGDVFMAAFLSCMGSQAAMRKSPADALDQAAQVAGEHVAGRGAFAESGPL